MSPITPVTKKPKSVEFLTEQPKNAMHGKPLKGQLRDKYRAGRGERTERSDMKSYDAIIIGTGIGGAAVGALLAHAG